MGLTREFASLGSFARFLDERTADIMVGGAAISVKVAKVLERQVKSEYGQHYLTDLAESTQQDRISKGFTPNDPLLRDGKLLRDSTEWAVGPDFAAVGSAEPIAGYHEHGYFNMRAQKIVPPRPVYRAALEESAPAVIAIMEENLGADLGFISFASMSDIATHASVNVLNVSDKE